MSIIVQKVRYNQNGPGHDANPSHVPPIPLQIPQFLEPFILYYLKIGLQAAGWTVVGYGDTQTSGLGDGILSPYGGIWDSPNNMWPYSSGGMGNQQLITGGGSAGSYYNIQQPVISIGQPGYPGGRIFTFKIGSSPSVGYSRWDHGTSGSILGFPGPFGKGILLPGFSFGSTTHNSLIQTTFFDHFVIAENTPPYRWVSLLTSTFGGSYDGRYCMFYEWVDGVLDSFQDPEPYVIGGWQGTAQTQFIYTALSQDNAGISAASPAYSWYGAGITGSEQFNQCIGANWSHNPPNPLTAPRNCGLNPWNGNIEEMPIFWTGNTQRSGLRHPKGYGDWIRWVGTQQIPADTFNGVTRISVADVSVPWDGISSAVYPTSPISPFLYTA